MNAAAGPPELARISDYPAYYARRTPEAEAAVAGDTRLSYAALDAAVTRCARALLAAGIGRGDRVAMLTTPRTEFLVVFLATASIGAMWVGLNPRYTLEEYRYAIGDSRPKLIVALSEFAGRDYRPELAALMAEHGFVERLVLLDGDWRAGAGGLGAFLETGGTVTDAALAQARDRVDPDDPALIVYTSGSTGRPKGAMLTHYGLVHCCAIQAERWPASPMRVLCNLPVSHVGGVGDTACYALVAGGLCVFMERFDPAGSLEAIERERITFWGQVPTMLQQTVAHADFTRRDLSSLQIVMWSGAAASRDLILALGRTGARLVMSYGMTELTGSVTYSDDDIGLPGSDPGSAELEILAETIGKPDPRYECRIVGEDGDPAPTGEPGELQFRGRWMMAGYFGRPEATAEAVGANGWLRSGDIGVMRADGNIQLVGRRTEMFKSGGYNVYPREIELAIETHPEVAVAAVVGVPDPDFQEVGWAYVVLEAVEEGAGADPGAGAAPDEAALRAHCRARLANYKLPKRFFIRPALPLLPIGKIDKTALRAEARAAVAEEAAEG